MKRRRAKSRPSGEPAASDLSGEKSSAAAPDLQGVHEGNAGIQQQKKNGGGDVSPTDSEEFAISLQARRRLSLTPFDLLQEVGRASPHLLTTVMKGKGAEYKTQHKKITSAAHTSHSSSSFVEEQEGASFDEEETGAEKEQPEPSSADGNLGKIAQDEDKHFGTKPSSEGLDKIIAPHEDKQNPDPIGVLAIQDQRHGRSLLNMDDDTIMKQISCYFDLLNFDPPDGHDNWSEYTPQQRTELYQRLAFYRIRGYQWMSSCLPWMMHI